MSIIFLVVFFLFLQSSSSSLPSEPKPQPPNPPTVCIIGAGIGGSSVSHFLRTYSPNPTSNFNIRIFERNHLVGGRMATVNVTGHTFEAGASILHPKNFHALSYTKLLNLTVNDPSSSSSIGIWDGKKFVFKTLSFNCKLPFVQKLVSLFNSVRIFFRYGFSILRMESFVENTVGRFLKYYESLESRPIFETVDSMLQWAGLYNLTTSTLESELADAGLSSLLIQELVTVITRINYGQSVSMSGLAGTVSLAGSGGGLWSIKGGNWQMAAGLINRSDVALNLQCTFLVYSLMFDIYFASFSISIFCFGQVYFGLNIASKIPELVGTIENPDIPFSSISVLKQHSETDKTYKVFSRQPMDDALLDRIFSVRSETIRINWGAYPHYSAPEVFAPFILDGRQLYYVNAFENAASTMETSAVAAENIARLILSRFFGQIPLSQAKSTYASDGEGLHADL